MPLYVLKANKIKKVMFLPPDAQKCGLAIVTFPAAFPRDARCNNLPWCAWKSSTYYARILLWIVYPLTLQGIQQFVKVETDFTTKCNGLAECLIFYHQFCQSIDRDDSVLYDIGWLLFMWVVLVHPIIYRLVARWDNKTFSYIGSDFTFACNFLYKA